MTSSHQPELLSSSPAVALMDPVLAAGVETLDGATRDTLDLIGFSIAEAANTELPLQDRSRQEEEILDFVEDLGCRDVVLTAFRRWFEEASRRHPARDRIAQFLEERESIGRAPTSEADSALRNALPEAEIVSRLESRGFVRHTPRMAELRRDAGRKSTFRFDRQSSFDTAAERGQVIYRMTESEGLQELGDFLDNFITRASQPRSQSSDRRFVGLGAEARSIRDNLTFIGTPELDEAAPGFASYWKAYLDGDPKRQICLPSYVGKLRRYRPERGGHAEKSDSYVRARILDALLEGDQAYAGRIVYSPEMLTADPTDAKIVIVDDCMVSGQQMVDVCSVLLADPAVRDKYVHSVEVNLLTSPRRFLQDGLEVESGQGTLRIPVRAYYEAYGRGKQGAADFGCRITTLHSTVNWGFADLLERMVGLLNDHNGTNQTSRHKLPALASVYRPYWPLTTPDVVAGQ